MCHFEGQELQFAKSYQSYLYASYWYSRNPTWYTCNVNMPCTLLEVLEPFSDNMGLGVVPDAAFKGLLLSLQHGRQARVRQALHYDTLHEGASIIVLDEPHPLQVRRSVMAEKCTGMRLQCPCLAMALSCSLKLVAL